MKIGTGMTLADAISVAVYSLRACKHSWRLDGWQFRIGIYLGEERATRLPPCCLPT